jgi:hypothetical protein
VPVQPSRIPVQLLREVSSLLKSVGIELLTRNFVMGTMRACRESIATIYDEIGHDVSVDAALQLVSDILFLEIALSSPDDGEFRQVREKLAGKVSKSKWQS